MKTPGLNELRTIVEYLFEELIDSQVQEILSTEEGLVLTLYRFHKEPKSMYLVMDLDRQFPFLGLFSQQPWKALKKPKPVGLFLNAHLKNLKITSIKLLEEFGRVVEIGFQDQVRLEMRLIPKQGNLLVELYEQNKMSKSISWEKLSPLQPLATSAGDNLPHIEAQDERSIPFMMKQWFERRAQSLHRSKGSSEAKADQQDPYQKWLKQKEKDRTKKQKALEAIQSQISEFQQDHWQKLGDYLKTYGFKNLPVEWSAYVDFEKSVSQNIQKCFEKKKQNESKLKGAQQRLDLIQNEIQELKDLSENRFQQELQRKQSEKQRQISRKIEGRFRKLQLDNNLECFMGKSAKDNLDLLRQSKAWDFWIHLKDYPSAHAILHRTRDQKISQESLIKCGQWLIREGLGDKFLKQGGKAAVVVVECRHVRPIKGDKLGRVTYHNAREILIAF